MLTFELTGKRSEAGHIGTGVQLLIFAAVDFSETTHHKCLTALRVSGRSCLKRPAVTLVSQNYCLIDF